MIADVLERLSEARGLPVPLSIARRVVRDEWEDEEGAWEFCETLSLDPGLSSAVLRFANARLGLGGEASGTVRDAVTRVGLRSSRVVALSSLLVSAEAGAVEGEEALEDVWRLSAARGIVARRLAERVEPKRAGEAFLAGVLWHLSIVALSRVDAGAMVRLARAQRGIAAEAARVEEAALGMSAHEASARMLRGWHVPRRLWGTIDACGTDAGAGDPSAKAREILRAADEAARALVFGGGCGEAIGRATRASEVIEAASWSAVIGSAEEEWRVRSTGLETFGAKDETAAEIRSRARAALADISLATELENRAMRRRQADLLRRVMTDSLTGVKNRAAFDERLGEEVERSQRSGKPMALLLCDLDHFKKFNDLYGHQAGDQMLKCAAGALARGARRADIVARYGGEEFAVIAPDCGWEGAAALAERLRRAVEEAEAQWRGQRLRCTISIGGAVQPGGAGGRSPADLVAAADRLLYLAKGAGRNRCRVEAGAGEAAAV